MKKALKGLYLTLIVLFLYLPIGTLMVLSFNSGKTMNAWTGFSLDWYEEMFQSQQIMEALKNTLTIAFWAATIATRQLWIWEHLPFMRFSKWCCLT